jgi:hypothetical protein
MVKFNYDNAVFDYEPYPICYIPQAMADIDYETLRKSYPPLQFFEHKAVLGNKYSLSEVNNRDAYYNFLKQNPEWQKLYDKIKSKEFIEEILAFLKKHNIDLGINDFGYVISGQKFGKLRRKFSRHKTFIKSRFEFSIMQGNGGHIKPHTDAPNKIITLVFSFIADGEWNEAWGGGTDVLLPKDRSKVYNHVNKQGEFADMEHIKAFPFNPNQLILFIKTYNSWHSVSPMKGPESALRKTLTINIEKLA